MKDPKLTIFIGISIVFLFLSIAIIPESSLNQLLANIVNVVFLLAIEFAIYVLIIYYFFFKSEYWINRKARKFAQKEKENQVSSHKTINGTCQKCGNSVILGDSYCQKCGTEVLNNSFTPSV